MLARTTCVLAALRLERQKLGDAAVSERRYERKLVRVENRHTRGRTIGPIGVVGELHGDP
jgi:hypothetical protein